MKHEHWRNNYEKHVLMKKNENQTWYTALVSEDAERGKHSHLSRHSQTRGFSFRFLKALASMFGQSLFHIGKQVAKKVAPDILDTVLQAGQDIMKGNKIKSLAKKAMSRMARTLGRSTRQTLEDKLARHASQK